MGYPENIFYLLLGVNSTLLGAHYARGYKDNVVGRRLFRYQVTAYFFVIDHRFRGLIFHTSGCRGLLHPYCYNVGRVSMARLQCCVCSKRCGNFGFTTLAFVRNGNVYGLGLNRLLLYMLYNSIIGTCGHDLTLWICFFSCSSISIGGSLTKLLVTIPVSVMVIFCLRCLITLTRGARTQVRLIFVVQQQVRGELRCFIRVCHTNLTLF